MACRRFWRILLSKHHLHQQNAYFHTTGTRCLFASDILGIENYKRQRATTQEKIGDLQDVFRKRMNDYMASAHNTIFTGDLKNMIYAASTKEDLDTVKDMIARFRQQRGELRFSNFVFGPLVMRMCHLLNQPDLAYQLFTHEPVADGFYDQMSTFVILMDLLFENGRYEDVIKVMDEVKDRRVAGFKFPSDCLVLLAAACCKLNTAESYSALQKVLEEAREAGNSMSLRLIVFSSLLAIKQNDPQTAMEILGNVQGFTKGKVPTAYTNLKVLSLTRLGREEDAMLELRCLLNQDGPDSRVYDVFPDVLQTLNEAVERLGNVVLTERMQQLSRGLEENSHIHTQEFEDYVFSPINRKRQPQDSYKSRPRSGAGGFSRQRASEGLRRQEDHASI